MPFLSHDGYRIRYELDGPDRGPAYVLVNGLTQYAELWRCYRDELVARNFRVLTFDLLGQANPTSRAFSSTSATRSRVRELAPDPGANCVSEGA